MEAGGSDELLSMLEHLTLGLKRSSQPRLEGISQYNIALYDPRLG